MADPTFPHHRLAIDRRLGTLHLQAEILLSAPWTLLFGPSGSGKSSLLRAVCGLLGNEGVSFSRREPQGPETTLISPTHTTPPHRLGLGYAPQQGALFPHLSVAENIGFAASVQRDPRAVNLDKLLDLFEIAPLRTRMPRMLSGGERQRVNLARAFAVPEARLLLLDEPFSGVGRALRDRLLPRMQRWTEERGIPVLSVSHDVDEALLLGADVFVLEEGQVVRRGAAVEALAAERGQMLRTLEP